MAGSPIVHIEFVSQDPQKTSEFFKNLFQWDITNDPSYPDYPMFQTSPTQGGGFLKPDGNIYKEGDVLVYLETDDIEGTLARAESLAGKCLLPKTEIPGMGWYAILNDPVGTRIAVYKGMPRE
jgi:predicted enzyme related to lactoylglutathione lyase